MEAISTYLNNHRDRFIDELKAFLRFASVSADFRYKPDLLACADFVADELRKVGFPVVERFETAGNPIIYGEWIVSADKPTVLFYGHYDVQPPDPLEKWISGPFDPTIRDGHIFARGTSDDKGQVFCHLKSIEAHFHTMGTLPVNVKFIIEGEEEVGSPNLFGFLHQHQHRLKADIAVVSDTPMLSEDIPSISTSLRGLCLCELIITAAKTDLHSGQHGGVAPNAIQILVEVLAKLKDENGKILIPGFYDDVFTIPADIRSMIRTLPEPEADYQKQIGTSYLIGEKDEYHLYERLWFRPTLEINGIIGGYTQEGTKTVIPNQASAKLSTRLVKNQDPKKIFALIQDHVKTLISDGVTLQIIEYPGCFAAMVDRSHPALKAAEKAVKKGFGKTPVLQGEGGSIPIVVEFEKCLNIQTVLLGFNLPHDQIHAPNEKFSLDHFYKGILTSAYFLEEFASL